MRDAPKPKGGKRSGAGRKRSSPDGLLRRSRTFTVTDTEHAYLRRALDHLRNSTSVHFSAWDEDTVTLNPDGTIASWRPVDSFP